MNPLKHYTLLSTDVLTVRGWRWDSRSRRNSSKGSVFGAAAKAVSTECAAKSLESDVKLDHILINKKAAEEVITCLGRPVYMYLLIYRQDLFDYAELFAHLDECVDCAVEVFTIVTC